MEKFHKVRDIWYNHQGGVTHPDLLEKAGIPFDSCQWTAYDKYIDSVLFTYNHPFKRMTPDQYQIVQEAVSELFPEGADVVDTRTGKLWTA